MTKRVGGNELGVILGQGENGIATNVKTKQEFAIKIIDKEKIKREELIESLKKEIHILMIINHPNIIKLIEQNEDLSSIGMNKRWRIYDKKQQIYSRTINVKIFQINYKSYPILLIQIYRDLNPENIFICNQTDQIKINDFELSSLFQDPSNLNNELYTTCGTIHYLAPEEIQSSGYDGHKADIW
ncbi:unnamed protein product [Paramecium sonneborni]|uniref:non-specific serine/threonine protein kinase n=1 Tax=Paramecium sonneborni TaxID=65129 RepID=A0A8S1PG40_9CILI|nr:unnamed protein product [Paramecium sonneborni]